MGPIGTVNLYHQLLFVWRGKGLRSIVYQFTWENPHRQTDKEEREREI